MLNDDFNYVNPKFSSKIYRQLFIADAFNFTNALIRYDLW